MKKNKSSISKEDSYRNIGEFWDNHDLADDGDKTEEAGFEVNIQSNITYYALDNKLSEQIQLVSRQRGITPETLVNLWIQEKLQDTV